MKDVKPIDQKVLSTIPDMPKDTAIVDTILSAGIDTCCLVADSVFATTHD